MEKHHPDRLAIECINLINKVKRRPGASKWLLKIKSDLTVFEDYKGNRRSKD